MSTGEAYVFSFVCLILPASIELLLGQHEAFYRSKHAQTIQDPSSKTSFVFLENEKLKIEESFKVCRESDVFLMFIYSYTT
jgi:hypothetical protein